VAPGVRLGGDVEVGEGALIGIGAVVLPGKKIGAWAVVGAGAVVTKDVAPNATVVGVPARPIST
jgi:acetyltransferase-like isoleucine patch superfamily enzyme